MTMETFAQKIGRTGRIIVGIIPLLVIMTLMACTTPVDPSESVNSVTNHERISALEEQIQAMQTPVYNNVGVVKRVENTATENQTEIVNLRVRTHPNTPLSLIHI